jgi:glycosyltransferase involved in cell wall biosynthesis
MTGVLMDNPTTSEGKPEKRSMRVLIVTENVSLRMSGETSVPLYYFNRLQARGVDVWMICHARTRDELRETLPSEIFQKISFVEDSLFQVLVYKFSHLFPYRIEDLIFGRILHSITQFQARKIVKQLVKDQNIDLVFEPSPISPRGLSFMYDIGVPTVIGPMCGGMDLPPAFKYMESPFTQISINIGKYLSQFANMLVPGKLRANALLVCNERTEKLLPKGHRAKVYHLRESGVDLTRWETKQHHTPQPDQPVRFIFCGRLIDWKGAQFLIEAFKTVAEQTNSVLDIIGDGKLRSALEARVNELGIQTRVKFHGRLALEDCMEMIRSSDVYVMPSVRECGGLALLETMAIGLPIVATKWGGPAEYLNSTCGILVEPGSKEQLIQGLAAAMIRLAESPELRRQLGEGARQRVRTNYFDWDSKVDRTLEIFKETLAEQQAKATQPDLKSVV